MANIEKFSRIISASNINEKSIFELIDTLRAQERIVIYGADGFFVF